jgi:chromosome segregation ATPase
VCAIVLGLGGKPRLLGRADSLGEFVKIGCSSAFVEIEVFTHSDDSHEETTSSSATTKNLVVRRTLKRGSDLSVWHVDGARTKEARVISVVKSLGINVDCLCTLLAQDKVGVLSGLDAPARLLEVEKALFNGEVSHK